MTRRTVRAAFALSALVALSACQALVRTSVEFTCEGNTLGVCPAGNYCAVGQCVACASPGEDACDGLDNDCNGAVDDGPLSDADGDHAPSCGTFDATTGQPVIHDGRVVGRDCDDTNDRVSPSATEICNGVDDNCDDVIDNDACKATELCAPAVGCVSKDAACTVTGCPAPRICDITTLVCTLPNLEAGSLCSGDGACKAGLLCANEAMLSASIYAAAGGNVCSKACCTSNDCSAGFVCAQPGTGGNYCVKPAWIGRSSAGTKLSGAACTGGSDCRSGLCTGSVCVDACCAKSDCPTGQTCALGTSGSVRAFRCVNTPTGKSSDNSSCISDGDCKSGFCSAYVGDPSWDYCQTPCRTAASCAGDLSCNNLRIDANSVVAICNYQTFEKGKKKIGEACTGSYECASYRCNSTTAGQRCVDVCGTDADCAEASGWSCKATLIQSVGSLLRCQP
jgi:hypothetical protein